MKGGKREEALEAVELDGILLVPQHRIIVHTEMCYSFNMWFTYCRIDRARRVLVVKLGRGSLVFTLHGGACYLTNAQGSRSISFVEFVIIRLFTEQHDYFN